MIVISGQISGKKFQTFQEITSSLNFEIEVEILSMYFEKH